MYVDNLLPKEVDVNFRFPICSEITYLLRKINRNLTLNGAEAYAGEIIKLNDSAQFEEAWLALDLALQFSS